MMLTVNSLLAIFYGTGIIATAVAVKMKKVSLSPALIKLLVYGVILFFCFAFVQQADKMLLLLLPVIFGFIGLLELVITFPLKVESNLTGIGKGLMLIAFGISFLLLMIFFTYPKEKITGLMFMVVVFDGFSQLTGQLSGKRKLCPKISPGKTVEGLAGGIFFVVVSFILLRDEMHSDWLLPVSAVSGGLAGDLCASFYKRLSGIKDFNSIIPGHGGFLDRFDSLFGAGAVYVVTSLSS